MPDWNGGAPRPTRRAVVVGGVSSFFAARTGAAQGAFPQRPVTVAVGFAPGGSTDIAARLVAERLSGALGAGARVVVENRAGGAGRVAADWLRRQPPDGYTLMLAEAASHAIAPAAMGTEVRYDPVADFTPLGVLITSPMVLVVGRSIIEQDPRAVLSQLRSAPAESLSSATAGVGSIPHLASEMLALTLGTRFLHVPYRSGGQMLTAIHQGQGQLGVAVLASAAGPVRDGLVRALAVTGERRLPSFPDIPTFAEAGFPRFDVATWNILLGPPAMSPTIVGTLNRALIETLADPGIRERLLNAGLDPWEAPNAPADAGRFLAAEVTKYREVVQRTGVRLEP